MSQPVTSKAERVAAIGVAALLSVASGCSTEDPVGPSDLLVTSAAKRSAGGWTSGSAISDVAWAEPSDANQKDPLESLTEAQAKVAWVAGSSTWGYYKTAWPVRTSNMALDQCPGATTADGVTRCSQLGAGTSGGKAQVFSVREQNGASAVGDKSSRSVARTVTLAAGRWKLSLDAVCALTDNNGQAQGPCDGAADGASGGVSPGDIIGDGTTLGGPVFVRLFCPDDRRIISFPVPPYRTRSRVEVEFVMPTCASNASPILMVAASNDYDPFQDEVTADVTSTSTLVQRKLANNYWRSTLIDNMRIEQIAIDAAEAQQGLADYLQILKTVGVTATSTPTKVAWMADHLERTEFNDPTDSSKARTVKYVELWHAPKNPVDATSVALEESKGKPFFFVGTRTDEVRPWTIPTQAEANAGSSTSAPLDVVRQQTGDAARVWFSIRNPTTATTDLTPYLRISTNRILYAVVQAPTLVHYDGLTASYKIVPASLVACPESGPNNTQTVVVRCPDWAVPKGTTRSFVLEVRAFDPARTVGTATEKVEIFKSQMTSVAPLDTLTLSVRTVAPVSASLGRGVLWSTIPPTPKDVLTSLMDHGITDDVVGGYIADGANPDGTLKDGAQTFTPSDPSKPKINLVGVFNSANAPQVGSLTSAGIQAGGGFSGWTLLPCKDQGQQVDGATVASIPYRLRQSVGGALGTATAYAGKITCSQGCKGANWTPAAGETVMFAYGSKFAIGRVGALSNDTKTLYLDVPLGGPPLSELVGQSGTLYRLFHTGGVNRLIIAAKGAPTGPTCSIDADNAAVIDPAYHACPKFAQLTSELDSASTASKTLWPLTCQRALVDESKSVFSDTEIDLDCYQYQAGAFAIDGAACHLWYKFNAEQTRLVDTLVASVASLFTRSGITGDPVVEMNSTIYDELQRFGRIEMFDGYGQSEVLDLASRFETAGFKTMIEHRPSYSVQQASMLALGLGQKAMSYPVPMAGSYAAASWLADNARYGTGGSQTSLFYGGGYGWAAQSPYLTRANAGLARLKVAADGAGPIPGIIAWNLIGNASAAPVDPYYAGSGCSATYGAPKCLAAARRDWLDFGTATGFDVGGGVGDVGMYLPSAATTDPGSLDATWDEAVIADMILEGHHDLRVAQSLGVSTSTQLAGVPYAIVAGPVSACTLTQVSRGVSDPHTVCKDYQP